ncbi:MAG: nucleotidyltransferase family protein [Methylobacterium sp.]|uniref:nucleotidyltransferase family protein n=1 Tax=Methylobacterium sp. TaxID=409 RepID=UPI0025DC7234|nr:nucleotidyltransferase family protein [Methylobacterium sp.]MBX9932439.1 nucleotidyltransferase family protein [Methylobacterium sp.]
MTDNVGIVLLAAGRGSRFGAEPKLLSLLDGKPLVRHAAEAALASGLQPVVVVLGAHAGRVRKALDDLGVTFMQNADHAAGLSTSLKAGLEALPSACIGAVVMLGDMPRISADHLVALAAAFVASERRASAVVPIHDGQRGNPVLLNRNALEEGLARLTGDRGAGPLLAGRTDVIEIAMDDAVLQDVDTPDALAALDLAHQGPRSV